MKQNFRNKAWTGILFMILSGSWWSGSPLLLAQSGSGSPYPVIREEAEKRYLPSDELLNGEKYNYTYRSDDGSPFFEIPGDPPASVVFERKTYTDQRIRYDMYNQVMVLEFTDASGAQESLVLHPERIGEVKIGGYLFQWLTDEEGKGRYGQVIGEGVYRALFFWEKQYLPDMHNGEEHYFFSDPVRKTFLWYGDRMCPYKRNISFVRCFPEALRDPVKGYMKAHRIHIRKASYHEVKTLLNNVNQWNRSE